MSESPDGTIISDSADAGIVDAHGVVYRLVEGGDITLNGIKDRTLHNVQKLAYVSGVVWAEDGRRLWHSRHNVNDEWSTGLIGSPILGDRLMIVEKVLNDLESQVQVLTKTVDRVVPEIVSINTNLTALNGYVQDCRQQLFVVIDALTKLQRTVDKTDAEVQTVVDMLDTTLATATSVTAIQGAVSKLLVTQHRQGAAIMATLADIQNSVTNITSVSQSIVTTLNTVAANLQAAIAANDPAAMQAVVDALNTDAQAMADAIVANTPAAPAEPAAPPAGA